MRNTPKIEFRYDPHRQHYALFVDDRDTRVTVVDTRRFDGHWRVFQESRVFKPHEMTLIGESKLLAEAQREALSVFRELVPYARSE